MKLFAFQMGGNIKVAGIINVKLKNKSFSFKDSFKVINNVQQPLLSCTASKNLNLIQRIFVFKSKLYPVKEFPKVFKGSGKVDKPYQIKSMNDSKPHAISVPPRVPKV